jgi:hypothetical protein
MHILSQSSDNEPCEPLIFNSITYHVDQSKDFGIGSKLFIMIVKIEDY